MDNQNENKAQGASCSIDSKPVANTSNVELPYIDTTFLQQLIDQKSTYVLIIGALWCGDCINQIRHLGSFWSSLKDKGINFYYFNAEGQFYDQFITPLHKQQAMQFYLTSIDAQIVDKSVSAPTDKTSVIGKRGREAYPTIFFVKDGVLKFWSLEDVSASRLEEVLSKISIT
jgi:hypothetical protein